MKGKLKHRSAKLLTIDQGTTSSRALVFEAETWKIVALAQREFQQYYPASGWVEHDGEELWATTCQVMREAMEKAGIDPDRPGQELIGVGITNQRETTVIWEKKTGKLLAPAIVWQDRRTADLCKAVCAQSGVREEVQQRSGLTVDPYFCATKIAWLLDNVQGARKRAEEGELLFGTIDSFLIWRLTAGMPYRERQAEHLSDTTNASRTSLFNINEYVWDDALLDFFKVPRILLAEVRPSCGSFGRIGKGLPGAGLELLGVAGDQQASLFGHGCIDAGMMKSTYGTGAFLLVHTGQKPLFSEHQLLTTCACSVRRDEKAYVLEGSIFIAGAALKWLKEELGFIETYAETGRMAEELDGEDGTGGLVVVPSFSGLGAPYWNAHARGGILGMTRGTKRAHIVRATLESLAYQTADLVAAFGKDGIDVQSLKVDGGVAASTWLMQFMANILQVPIIRPAVLECTALGATYCAALGAGICSDAQTLFRDDAEAEHFAVDGTFSHEKREGLLRQWRQAVHAITAFAVSGEEF